MHNLGIYKELQELIAKYDWAVEGAPKPWGQLQRAEAIKIRNGLVRLSQELVEV